jgi:hypothetical protein
MALLRQLAAKQKLEKQNAQLKRELLLAKRRGYAKAGYERALLRKIAESGLQDLPDAVAVAIQELPAPARAPAPVKAVDTATAEELTARLTAIRERLFWLQAVWAATLSSDVYHEADRYRDLFHTIGERLSAIDPAALDRLVVGHEALLLAEPASPKPQIPLATQEWCETRWAAMQAPRRDPKPSTTGDGLDWLLR